MNWRILSGLGIATLLGALLFFLSTPRPPEASVRTMSVRQDDSSLESKAEDSRREAVQLLPTAEDSQDHPALLVRIHDMRGAPIPGAELLAHFEQVLVGRTNNLGEVIIYPSELYHEELFVRAAGYYNHGFMTPDTLPAEMTITLRSIGHIIGFVAQSDGTPASNAYVIAWKTGFAPSGEQLRRAASGKRSEQDLTALDSSSIRAATTGPDGSFEIVGVLPDQSYTLTAAASASFCSDRLYGVLPSDDPVALSLKPAYGAVVRLRDLNGEAIKTGKAVFGKGMFWEIDDFTAESLPVKLPEFELAGETALTYLSCDERDNKLFLYRSTSGSDTIGPISYSAHIPGYEPVSFEFWANRLDRGIAEYVIQLTPSTDGWGSVRIICVGGGLDSFQQSLWKDIRPLGVLHLKEASGQELSIPVRPPMVTVDGLPWGSYEARFSANTYYQFPSDDSPAITFDLSVGSGINDIPIHFDATSALQISIMDTANQPYAGTAVFEFVNEHQGWKFYKSFVAGPYSIPAVLPGDYQVRITNMGGTDAGIPDPLSVSLVSDEIAVCAFSLHK